MSLRRCSQCGETFVQDGQHTRCPDCRREPREDVQPDVVTLMQQRAPMRTAAGFAMLVRDERGEGREG